MVEGVFNKQVGGSTCRAVRGRAGKRQTWEWGGSTWGGSMQYERTLGLAGWQWMSVKVGSDYRPHVREAWGRGKAAGQLGHWASHGS